MYENPWTFNEVPVLEIDKKYYGFVYLITEIKTGKKYIGKKSIKMKRKQKNGKRRTTESDWRSYYSSNDYIKTEAKKNKFKFKREIIRLCKTKGEMNFFEVEEQFKRDVLKLSEFLNENILGKYFRSNILKYER